MEPLFLERVPSHLRQHILSAGILKDLGERPQVTGPPHSSILGAWDKGRSRRHSNTPHTHLPRAILAAPELTCSNSGFGGRSLGAS